MSDKRRAAIKRAVDCSGPGNIRS